MTGKIGLNALKPGEKGIINDLLLKQDMNKRLQDMGFVRGAEVECVYKAPFGDPAAYFIKGTLIAVRDAESQNIIVECREAE